MRRDEAKKEKNKILPAEEKEQFELNERQLLPLMKDLQKANNDKNINEATEILMKLKFHASRIAPSFLDIYSIEEELNNTKEIFNETTVSSIVGRLCEKIEEEYKSKMKMRTDNFEVYWNACDSQFPKKKTTTMTATEEAITTAQTAFQQNTNAKNEKQKALRAAAISGVTIHEETASTTETLKPVRTEKVIIQEETARTSGTVTTRTQIPFRTPKVTIQEETAATTETQTIGSQIPQVTMQEETCATTGTQTTATSNPKVTMQQENAATIETQTTGRQIPKVTIQEETAATTGTQTTGSQIPKVTMQEETAATTGTLTTGTQIPLTTPEVSIQEETASSKETQKLLTTLTVTIQNNAAETVGTDKLVTIEEETIATAQTEQRLTLTKIATPNERKEISEQATIAETNDQKTLQTDGLTNIQLKEAAQRKLPYFRKGFATIDSSTSTEGSSTTSCPDKQIKRKAKCEPTRKSERLQNLTKANLLPSKQNQKLRIVLPKKRKRNDNPKPERQPAIIEIVDSPPKVSRELKQKITTLIQTRPKSFLTLEDVNLDELNFEDEEDNILYEEPETDYSGEETVQHDTLESFLEDRRTESGHARNHDKAVVLSGDTTVFLLYEDFARYKSNQYTTNRVIDAFLYLLSKRCLEMETDREFFFFKTEFSAMIQNNKFDWNKLKKKGSRDFLTPLIEHAILFKCKI